MHIVILALLAALASTTAQAADCLGKDALAAARNFATRQRDFYRADPVQLYGTVEARLLAALAADYRCKDGQTCAIAADPWKTAPDGEIRKPVEFKLLSASDNRAAVEMRYTLARAAQRQAHSVRLQLTRGGPQACWLVGDLILPVGGSLVQRIEDWHDNNAPGVYLIKG